jgi:hypothetical protein
MRDSLIDRLRAEDPETGLRHSIASEAADHIEALEKAICDYAAAVVGMEGVTFEEYIKDDASQKIVVDVLNARAALEGKDD